MHPRAVVEVELDIDCAPERHQLLAAPTPDERTVRRAEARQFRVPLAVAFRLHDTRTLRVKDETALFDVTKDDASETRRVEIT